MKSYLTTSNQSDFSAAKKLSPNQKKFLKEFDINFNESTNWLSLKNNSNKLLAYNIKFKEELSGTIKPGEEKQIGAFSHPTTDQESRLSLKITEAELLDENVIIGRDLTKLILTIPYHEPVSKKGGVAVQEKIDIVKSFIEKYNLEGLPSKGGFKGR